MQHRASHLVPQQQDGALTEEQAAKSWKSRWRLHGSSYLTHSLSTTCAFACAYSEEISHKRLNKVRGIVNHERVDEELYQDFETGDAKKAGAWAVSGASQDSSCRSGDRTLPWPSTLQPQLGQLGAA